MKALGLRSALMDRLVPAGWGMKGWALQLGPVGEVRRAFKMFGTCIEAGKQQHPGHLFRWTYGWHSAQVLFEISSLGEPESLQSTVPRTLDNEH